MRPGHDATAVPTDSRQRYQLGREHESYSHVEEDRSVEQCIDDILESVILSLHSEPVAKRVSDQLRECREYVELLTSRPTASQNCADRKLP